MTDAPVGAVAADKPIDVVTEHVNITGNGYDFGAASSAPRLNRADRAAIYCYEVAAAPSAEGLYLGSGLYLNACL